MTDNYDLWDAYDIAREMKLARLPKCKCCKEHIQQEDAVCIDGEYICDECLDDMRELIAE